MVPGRAGFALAAVCALALPAAGQQIVTVQSPREAVIEMITGGPEKFRKHLTPEVQDKLAASQPAALALLTAAAQAANPNLQTHLSGNVLLTLDNAQQNERLEVHVDNELRSAELDEMHLSFHTFRDGREEDFPIGFRVVLTLRQQAGIWRLNTITLNASIPVGDPRLYDSSLWNPTMMASGNGPAQPPETSENTQPKMPAARAVHLITVAEDIYARKHPQTGFTCDLGELVNIGKGMDENGEYYNFMDSGFADGTYNSYSYRLSGCGGKSNTAFIVTAEPATGNGKAYCSDATHIVRISQDGKAMSCITAGKAILN
jgi:hypothetical protein